MMIFEEESTHAIHDVERATHEEHLGLLALRRQLAGHVAEGICNVAVGDQWCQLACELALLL